ncbi:MAG TPA: hypothetical protein DCG28_06780 [Lachnospiraceae bacterium]|nr:hypothetical protein [Lachnospiraceae bacterium]
MDKKSLTLRGNGWEKRNSKWLIAPWLFLGGPAFLYIGVKANRFKWIMYGFFYSMFMLIPALSFPLYIITIVHAYKVKDEYLIRLDAEVTRKEKLYRSIREKRAQEEVIDGDNVHFTPELKQDQKGRDTVFSTQAYQSFQKKPSAAQREKIELYEHVKAVSMDDYFKPLSKRVKKNVYFYTVKSVNAALESFLLKYYEEAFVVKEFEVVENSRVSEYEYTVGHRYERTVDFYEEALKKWLPQLNKNTVKLLSYSLYNTINLYKKYTDQDEKAVFIKLLVCLKYNMYPLLTQLGGENPPKLFCELEDGVCELMLLNAVSDIGCDVILIYKGEIEALLSEISEILTVPGGTPVSTGFDISYLEKRANALKEAYESGKLIRYKPSTNTFPNSDKLTGIKIDPLSRGEDIVTYYNAFVKLVGVWNRTDYITELYDLYNIAKQNDRGVCITKELVLPNKRDIENISFNKEAHGDELIASLAENIQYGLNIELQWIMIDAFKKIMQNQGGDEESIVYTALCIITWLKNIMSELFISENIRNTGLFIKMGDCSSTEEKAFLLFLSLLPTDVLILVPDKKTTAYLSEKDILVKEYIDILELKEYPIDRASYSIDTLAYSSEKEIEGILYDGTGLYKDMQYSKANAITLKNTFEETEIYWKEPFKYRPEFSVKGDAVNLPVIFMKISGVPRSDISSYWEYIHSLWSKEVLLMRFPPMSVGEDHYSCDNICRELVNKGKIDKAALKGKSFFKYGYLRGEILEYMLDKAELLIQSKIIAPVYAEDTDGAILSVLMNLPEEIVRKIQSFDFTKDAPKLIYIYADREEITFEDAVIIAYLNIIGFDVLIFVPTGYSCVERYYTDNILTEYKIGDYMYNLKVPDIATLAPRSKFEILKDRVFKKGGK